MNAGLQTWAGQIPWGPVVAVVLVVVVWFVFSSGSKKKRVNLQAKLDEGAYVIDVRTKGEFQSGHYQGAVNIPVETIASQTKKLGATDRPIVVYCASGARSSRAASVLRSAGFTNVTDAGGYGNMPR